MRVSELEMGWCEPQIEAELPGLRAVSLPARVALARPLDGRSPKRVSERLHELSNRWRGARAVNVRQEHVPSAYRVFFRQIGLDPDLVRTPVEQLVLERMVDGGFLSKGPLADVLTIASLDTGVAVWALEQETLDGPLGVRLSRQEERLGGGAEGTLLQAGQIVLADARAAVAVLFGEVAATHLPAQRSRTVKLFAVQVPGVPLLHVEEALWAARGLLEGG